MLQLNGIEHMYQYSLDSFTLFFQKALATATASSDKATAEYYKTHGYGGKR
jgi:hypothetical protein